MPEPEDQTPSPPDSDSDSKPTSSAPRESRRMRITPEQRRFLGPARTRHDWVGADDKSEPTEAAVPPKATEEEYAPPVGETPVAHTPPVISETARPMRADERESEDADPERGPERPRQMTRRVERQFKLSQILEAQNIALILGALLVLVVAFYVGKRFEYWKYLILSRNQAQLPGTDANQFPNVSAAELIDRAIVEEKLGNWKEAADRFVAAKRKNLYYSGLLYRAGKLYYDHSNFDSADTLFERAIAFKEDVDSSNYYRGMIASGRGDYPAAERFYEAASGAAPFNADYLYSWAEVLRRDRRPREAVARYEQAALRAGEAEENVCRFKMRTTMIEAGDVNQVSADLELKKAAGELPVDWLMTEAALAIQAGQLDEAVRLVQEARISDRSLLHGHFAACAGDKFFSEASNKYPEIAEACRLQSSTAPKGLGR